MKRKFLSCLFALFFIFVFSINAQAKTIWQIGIRNDSFFREFTFPDKDIIEYEVPPNWEEIQAQKDTNWGEFPAALYTCDDNGNNPREIKINFNYLEEYNNPTLIFRVTPESIDQNTPHYL